MHRYIDSDKVATPVLRSVRLIDQLRERIRYLHYSLQTEKAYLYWARFFIRWHGRNGAMRHPKDMGKPEVESFLTMLANERQVSPATHRQALNALLFLYKQVIGQDLTWLQSIGRPPERKRVPVVLTAPEVQSVLGLMEGVEGTLARLLYGTGMRLAEGLNLRVKDVDFDRHVVIVRSGKGDKDRVVMLPVSLVQLLKTQLAKSRSLWAADRASGQAGVFMPHALDAKYPRAGQSWAWHWVFPSKTLSIDPRTGVERRHHLFEERLGRKLKVAVEQAAIRHRHSDRARAFGARRCQYDHDLYPRTEGCCRRCQKPARCAHWTDELNVGLRCTTELRSAPLPTYIFDGKNETVPATLAVHCIYSRASNCRGSILDRTHD